MAKYPHTIATAILSAALVVGGASFAAAHHGDVSEHSTTKGKNLSAIEMKERQITAELNRKQLAPQLAMIEAPAMPSEIPALQSDDQAALTSADPADIAAVEEDDAEATN